MSYAESIDGASQLQINCNPGGQLTAGQQGLFVTIQPGGTVMLHNHNTPLGDVDAATLAVDVTSKVTLVSKTADGTKTTEVLIPMDAFRISDASFTFSAGEMACSAFAVIMKDGAAAEVAAAVSSDLSDWTTSKLGLGTLTLAAASGETPSTVPPTEQPTQAPTQTPDKNPGTGDSGWLIPSLCVAALAIAVVAIVYRRTKIKL